MFLLSREYFLKTQREEKALIINGEAPACTQGLILEGAMRTFCALKWEICTNALSINGSYGDQIFIQ